MKWTKDELKRTFVKTNTERQRHLAVQFYLKHGFKEFPIKSGDDCEVILCTGNGWVAKMKLIAASNYKEIDLFYRKKRKFPREMMVSQDEKNWHRKTVLGKLKTLNCPYITDKEENEWSDIMGWSFAKEVVNFP